MCEYFEAVTPRIHGITTLAFSLQVLIAEATGTTGIDLADVVAQLQLLQTYLPPVDSETFDAAAIARSPITVVA
jgi:hypothetical protein